MTSSANNSQYGYPQHSAAAGAAHPYGQVVPGQTPGTTAHAYQPQWYQGPDGTYYVLGQDGRLYPMAPQSATAVPAQPAKRKGKARFWVAIIVAVACVAAALLVGLNTCADKSNRSGTLGSVAGMNEDQIRDELDRVVSNGMFNISIASLVQFADGSSEGDWKIENPETNRFLMAVDVTRDDTGESVYSTDMIEPGYMVYADTLKVALPKGTYPCTATFTAYNENEQEMGSASAGITIEVAS